MLKIIKSIIVDFQESELVTGVPRSLTVQSIPDKATVCIGVRRSGKSTYMFQIMQRLLDKGISCQNILYINFFDDRLHDLQHGGLEKILEAYFSLYPEKKDKEKIFCFFDEIQVVSGWEIFIARLLRSEKCEVYITGSSAQMLAKEIATQMRGRALSWEVFPFSFTEFLDYKQIDSSARSTRNRFLIQNAFEEYWERGGFPEVRNVDEHLRIKIHQEYFNTILFRDLVERHDISHPKAVSDLAHWMANNIASQYSINNLFRYLKSLGHKLIKSAVSEYLEWFEDAYFFFSVPIFNASITKTNANPKKIYCIDHALVPSISSRILVNSGHLLENLVFLCLRRTFSSVFYYKTKNGREIDFLVQSQGRSRMLFQVCESLSNSKTRDRELLALKEAMIELDLFVATIVTKNEEEVISCDGREINVLPAWRFCLQKY